MELFRVKSATIYRLSGHYFVHEIGLSMRGNWAK